MYSFTYDPGRGELTFEGGTPGELLIKREGGEHFLRDLEGVVEEFLREGPREMATLLPEPILQGGREGLVYLKKKEGHIVGRLILLPGRPELERIISRRYEEEHTQLRHFLDDILNNMLYELRNSFSQILLTINLIELRNRSRLPEDVKKRFEEMREEIDYALSAVEKSSRRISSLFEEMPLKRKPVSIADILRETVEATRDLLRMKKITVKNLCTTPVVTLLDAPLMRSSLEALMELIYFRAEVNSEVTLFCEQVKDDTLQVVISYTGEEMVEPGELSGGVYGTTSREEFFRFRYEFLKSVVEKHEGRVRVESLEGVGSTIFIELPVLNIVKRDKI